METLNSFDISMFQPSTGSFVFGIVVAVLAVVILYKIFEKAGVEGWKAFIPLYNIFVLYELTWGNGFVSLLLLVPIVDIVISVMTAIKLADMKAYRRKADMEEHRFGGALFSLTNEEKIFFGKFSKRLALPPGISVQIDVRTKEKIKRENKTMKNRLAAIIIATSLVLGLGAGVGGAFIYNNAKNVKTTEVTATVENAADTKAEETKAETVTAAPKQDTQKASDQNAAAKKAAEEKAAKEAAQKKEAEKKAAKRAAERKAEQEKASKKAAEEKAAKKAAEKKAAEEKAAKKAAEKKAAEEQAAKKAAEKKAAEEKAAKKAAEKKAAEEQAAKKAAEKKAAEEKAAKEAAEKKAAEEQAARKAAEKKAAEEQAAREAAEKKAAEEQAARDAEAEKNTVSRKTVEGMVTDVNGNSISVRIEGGNATFDISKATVNGTPKVGDNVSVTYNTDGTDVISVISVTVTSSEADREANVEEWYGNGEQAEEQPAVVEEQEAPAVEEQVVESAAEEQENVEPVAAEECYDEVEEA